MIWNAKNGQVSIDGTSMSYASFGRGSKKLVILPGLSDGLTTVRGKALLLARPYARYFDQFTIWMFSRKDDLPEGYTIRDMADDQAKAMKAIGIESARVMGVSEGGMIAQRLAIQHPEMVEKLVLAVTAPETNDLIRESVTKWIAFAESGDHKSLMIDTAEKSYSESYLKKYRKAYPLLGHLGKPASYRRFLVNARAILSFSATEELGRVTCPTLIIGGEADKIVGIEASRIIHERISGSQLHIFHELGHAAYEEAKDFNERVFGFLDGRE